MTLAYENGISTVDWAGEVPESPSPVRVAPVSDRQDKSRGSSLAALAAVAIAVTGAGVLANTDSGIAAPAGPATDFIRTTAPSTAPAPQNNAAIEWNAALLDITAVPPAPGAAPSTIEPTRNFAILALAIDGAVNSIDHTHRAHHG